MRRKRKATSYYPTKSIDNNLKLWCGEDTNSKESFKDDIFDRKRLGFIYF